MDSSTQKLKDMIQRMTELDTSEEKQKQLNEALTITGDSGDEVASFMKSLQHNAGLDAEPEQSAAPMPARQDMERLAGIVGDPEPAAPGEDDMGGIEKKVHGMPPAESVEEASSGENAKEVESLHGMVRRVAKGDRRAKREFEDHISKMYTGIDAARFLLKLSKMDDGKQVEVIHNLVRDGQRQQADVSSASTQGSTFEDLDEWSSQDADTLKMLHGLVQSAANGDRRAGFQFEDYIDNNFPHVNSEELIAKLVKMDDNQQFETLHDMLTSEYQSDADDDYTDQSMRSGELGMEGYDNEPDEEHQDTEYMTKDISGGLNRQKKAYADAEDGDNPMAVESIKDRLYSMLSEKKAKPDYADIDGDGDKKEPMKKAAKDKKKKK